MHLTSLAGTRRAGKRWAGALLTIAALSLASACGSDSGSGDDVDAVGTGIDATRPDARPPDASVPDATLPDAPPPDAAIVMSIDAIFPQGASRLVDTELTVEGYNIDAAATIVLSSCDTATTYTLAPVTVSADGRTLSTTLLTDVAREQGLYTVTVTNPDGQTDLLECAFRILAQPPPTVTNVVPASAHAGAPGDGVSSDALVTITGTGFAATPSVRWVLRGGTASYDALYVGYVSDTQLSVVVPSETLQMGVGAYDVYVVNPDLLVGQWILPDLTPGTFTITATAPPSIQDVSPVRIEGSGACGATDITISGGGFAPTAQVYFIAPPGTVCAGSLVDANGATLCPMTTISAAAGTVVAEFGVCPANGPYPIVVVNPDGQSDAYYSITLTPSSDGHLNVGAFTIEGSLVTARWRHGATFGFDAFGGAHLYAVGGQDATGGVLETTEVGPLTIFGTPGSFDLAQQFLDAANPRVPNALTLPRQGGTLARVGGDLFYIGGATVATDTTTLVAAETTVERATILSYDEMPGVQRPVAMSGGSLPVGGWYYQVSAVGPWGESLGSREVVALRSGGTIHLCWSEPRTAGATSYNVYRSLAADGRGSSTSLLAVGVTTLCYDDTGTGIATPAPANLRGQPVAGAGFTAGSQSYRVSATVDLAGTPFETLAGYAATIEVTAADVTAGNAAVQLSWDPIPTATYAVYRWDPATTSYLQIAAGLTDTRFLDAGTVLGALLPRDEIPSLAAGALSLWQEVTPSLTTAREGADSIVIAMDPATSGGVAARILVAGGRSDSVTTASYLTSAESLGVMEDGTLEAAWFPETPVFTSARAYFALVTTQDRDVTPFPPGPEEPPCGDFDGDGVVSCACAVDGAPADCNDADPSIYPGAPEVCGDDIDQDCDTGCGGTDLACTCDDADGDGHVPTSCGGDDCCDAGTEGSLGCAAGIAGTIHPGAVDGCGDAIDQDCDGTDPVCSCTDDLDGDGHVSLACGGDDCCDVGSDVSLGCTDATATEIHPGATDTCADEEGGIDRDCRRKICSAGPGPSEPLPDLPARPGVRPVLPAGVPYLVRGDEPVFVVAVFGDDTYAATGNSGQSDLEACAVDDVTGHLECGPTWTVQASDAPHDTIGADAVLYFSYLYPFYAVASENVTAAPSTRALTSAAISRFVVTDPDLATPATVIGTRQSASTSFAIKRSYYQMVRLMSFVYVLGGWAEAHTDPVTGLPVPAGPTATIERHDQ